MAISLIAILLSFTVRGIQSQDAIYTVTIQTGDVRGAGTDADVYVQIVGCSGRTPKTVLDTPQKNEFERGDVDVFTITAPDVGKIERILIGHDDSGGFADWYIESVKIERNNFTLVFPCGGWIDDDITLERNLQPGIRCNSLNTREVNYTITIRTADADDAGTDANVFAAIYGYFGHTDVIYLKAPDGDDFERGDKNVFYVTVVNLGLIQELLLGHDGTNDNPSWYVASVLIEDPLSGLSYEFPCDTWLGGEDQMSNTMRFAPGIMGKA